MLDGVNFLLVVVVFLVFMIIVSKSIGWRIKAEAYDKLMKTKKDIYQHTKR